TASMWRGGAALHFDTGMNRLGLAVEEAVTFTARVKMPGNGIALIMSHLACADTPNHELNAKPIAAFRHLPIMLRGNPTPPRHPGLARQLVGYLPRAGRALRFGAPGRRPVRHQSDTRNP